MFEQAGRSRAYRRRQKYLKDKRRKEISKYHRYGINFWFNDQCTNHIKWIDYQERKKYAKRCGTRAWRRSNDEAMKGSRYKRCFDA